MLDRIESVRALPVVAPLVDAWDFGIEPYRRAAFVLVEVTTASGLVGHGECIVRKSPRTATSLVDDLLAPMAVGRDVADWGDIWLSATETLRRWGHSRGFLYEALSGLDIALWDVRAKALGSSLRDLLPGRRLDCVQAYASSVYFQSDVDSAAALARQLVADGFQAIKIKVGHRPEQGGLRRDVATVRAIREAVGDEIDLMCDANGAYTLASARRFSDAVRDCDLVWLEEPLPPDDLDGYARLAECGAVPLAAGECEFSVFGFRDLIQRGTLSFAQPDVARCGGITGALQIASLCYAHNVPVCFHTGFSGGINNLVSLILSSVTPGAGPLEYMIIGNPLRDLFTDPLPAAKGGRLDVPGGLGLGFQVDTEKLKNFATASSARVPARR